MVFNTIPTIAARLRPDIVTVFVIGIPITMSNLVCINSLLDLVPI